MKNKINSYVWKYPKEYSGKSVVQKEVKLVDCDIDILLEFKNHCEKMLNNDSHKTLGRYNLIELCKEQRLKCNTELFLRWIEKEHGISRFNFTDAVRGFLAKNKESISDIKLFTIDMLIGQCPDEFKNIPIQLIQDGCLDRLGKLNKDSITMAFILSFGFWFSNEDLKEFNGKLDFSEKLDHVKSVLNIGSKTNLKLSPNGFNFNQLRAMINLRSKKYSELTTEQLTVLRNKVLYSLEDVAQKHISIWENKINQINQVLDWKRQ